MPLSNLIEADVAFDFKHVFLFVFEILEIPVQDLILFFCDLMFKDYCLLRHSQVLGYNFLYLSIGGVAVTSTLG